MTTWNPRLMMVFLSILALVVGTLALVRLRRKRANDAAGDFQQYLASLNPKRRPECMDDSDENKEDPPQVDSKPSRRTHKRRRRSAVSAR